MRDLQAAVDDVDVRAILLNVDSPGGEASGVSEFANAVRAVRGKKPIVAYAGDLAASAAYWIGSAADRLVIGQGAALGSIGVRMTMSDTSARDERTGLRRFDFVSSQSPFKVSDPSKKPGAARIQARIDALANVFVAAVAENRGVSVAHVLDAFGRGDCLIGEAAIAAGMADSFGSFESTLAALARGEQPTKRPVPAKASPGAALMTLSAPPAPVRPALPVDVAAFIIDSGRRAEGLIAGRSPDDAEEEAAVRAMLDAHRLYRRP
jgi:ClpP class serine protease